MPSVNIFQTLRDRVIKAGGVPPRQKKAMFWYKNYTTILTKWQKTAARQTPNYDAIDEQDFSKQAVGANKAWPGFFYCFMYDPKWKLQLPYYDRFPFTLVLSVEDDRFMGLNFHYLDYYRRAALFDIMYSLRNTTKNNIRTKMLATYGVLKRASKYKAFRPCLKEYLVGHVRTPLLKIGANDWDIALFLPVEKFVKASKSAVWQASIKKIH